jgi:hypothetical protein
VRERSTEIERERKIVCVCVRKREREREREREIARKKCKRKSEGVERERGGEVVCESAVQIRVKLQTNESKKETIHALMSPKHVKYNVCVYVYMCVCVRACVYLYII